MPRARQVRLAPGSGSGSGSALRPPRAPYSAEEELTAYWSWCKFCNTCYPQRDALRHEASPEHELKVRKKQRGPVHCGICNVYYGSLCAADHKQGKKHMKNLALMRNPVS